MKFPLFIVAHFVSSYDRSGDRGYDRYEGRGSGYHGSGSSNYYDRSFDRGGGYEKSTEGRSYDRNAERSRSRSPNDSKC